MVSRGDHHELAESTTGDPRTVSAVDQLVMIDKERGEHQVRLFPGMSAEALCSRIEALGATPDRIHLRADEATTPKYLAILRELYPGWTFTEAGGSEAGVHQVKGRMEFTFRADYYHRAIAKIGFHYYLCNSHRGKRGDEPEFDDIRRFILEGGDHEVFFSRPSARFALPFGELPDGRAILPSTWAHMLAADETCGNAVAMVSLFMGPEHLAQTHHIYLGRFKSPLVVPDARHAHVYEYYAEPSQASYAGRVIAVSTTRVR